MFNGHRAELPDLHLVDLPSPRGRRPQGTVDQQEHKQQDGGHDHQDMFGSGRLVEERLEVRYSTYSYDQDVEHKDICCCGDNKQCLCLCHCKALQHSFYPLEQDDKFFPARGPQKSKWSPGAGRNVLILEPC